MRNVLFGEWTFGSAKESYARARRNEGRAAKLRRGGATAEERTLARLAGEGRNFLLGTLFDGTPVRISPDEIAGHGMIWGASGAGKTRGAHVLMSGWVESGRRLTIIDNKNETGELESLHAAHRYLTLPEEERETFAARFQVFDVEPGRLTPVDLWTLPQGMSPALLASLRTAATSDVSSHSFSDLMTYGMFMIFSVAINLGWGVTVRFVRAFLLDPEFRSRITSQISDERLRDSVTYLETTLPEQTRKAIVRQFDILLASAPARISYGLSPGMSRELLPKREFFPLVSIGNFGPTPQRPPTLAKTMATNRLIDVLTAVSVRPTPLPELLVLEELGVLVSRPTVAEYVLEASRTLRWKGLGIVAITQEPANAIPKETLNAMVLNAKWFLAYECSREEALWLFPHMPARGKREPEEKRGFVSEMARLPTQEAVLVRKGLPGFRLRILDVPDPTKEYERAELLETFASKIAARSMVSITAADDRIARFEATVFDQREMPVAGPPAPKRSSSPGSLEEFFALLKNARKESEEA